MLTFGIGYEVANRNIAHLLRSYRKHINIPMSKDKESMKLLYHRYLRRAADRGDIDSMVTYGDALVQEGEHDMAMSWYSLAAKHNSIKALFGIAHLYELEGSPLAWKFYDEMLDVDKSVMCRLLVSLCKVRSFVFKGAAGSIPTEELDKFNKLWLQLLYTIFDWESVVIVVGILAAHLTLRYRKTVLRQMPP